MLIMCLLKKNLKSWFIYERLKIEITFHFLANSQLAGKSFSKHSARGKYFLPITQLAENNF
jgi:hypothetical protein